MRREHRVVDGGDWGKTKAFSFAALSGMQCQRISALGWTAPADVLFFTTWGNANVMLRPAEHQIIIYFIGVEYFYAVYALKWSKNAQQIICVEYLHLLHHKDRHSRFNRKWAPIDFPARQKKSMKYPHLTKSFSSKSSRSSRYVYRHSPAVLARNLSCNEATILVGMLNE